MLARYTYGTYIRFNLHEQKMASVNNLAIVLPAENIEAKNTIPMQSHGKIGKILFTSLQENLLLNYCRFFLLPHLVSDISKKSKN
jgi:hypothetical protein